MMDFEAKKFKVGDVIRILSMGDWLLNDLLEAEKKAILACVGTQMTIDEIDQWGGIWVAFDHTTNDEHDASFSSQRFLVEPKRIEWVRSKELKI